MSSAQPLAPEQIAADATWLVQALDPAANMVRLIEMSRDDYRSASFLDDRMLQKPVNAHVVPWTDVRDAVRPSARRDSRWIFHIGHVGSTLVARLLGELREVLSVREPRFLRDITAIPEAERPIFADVATALFSRTFGPGEFALVKATSFVSELAPDLVPTGERALFMYATARNYIGSILAGENSVQELRMLAPVRAERLGRRMALPGIAKNDVDLAALAWACEISSLEAAAETMPDRLTDWADFDCMLGDMPAELARISKFFGFSAGSSDLEAIVGGPLMSRYSKALEYDYSAQLRQDLIAEALAANKSAIDGALAMLGSAAENSPLLRRALDRAGEI